VAAAGLRRRPGLNGRIAAFPRDSRCPQISQYADVIAAISSTG
jgi:hypothetical protein